MSCIVLAAVIGEPELQPPILLREQPWGLRVSNGDCMCSLKQRIVEICGGTEC